MAHHPNLSPGINAFIEKADRNNGFELTALPADTIFEIHTQNSVYTVVVIDPKTNAIALMGTRRTYEEPELYSFMGSSFGMSTSMLKVGWVGVGLHFRMQSIDGQLITTTELKSFVMLNDPEKAREIREKAVAKNPNALTPATEDELAQWQAQFDKQIEADFAGEHLASIQKWLGGFCPQGKCIAAQFFFGAHKIGKLKEAIETIERHFRSHWNYKHPDIRGSTFTPSDMHQWRLAYEETGVPFPK